MTIKLVRQAVEDLIANSRVDGAGRVTVSTEDLLLLGAQVYGMGQGHTGTIKTPSVAEVANELGWIQTERAITDEYKVEYVISKVVELNS
jgi:hypothetical protein